MEPIPTEFYFAFLTCSALLLAVPSSPRNRVPSPPPRQARDVHAAEACCSSAAPVHVVKMQSNTIRNMTPISNQSKMQAPAVTLPARPIRPVRGPGGIPGRCGLTHPNTCQVRRPAVTPAVTPSFGSTRPTGSRVRPTRA